MKNGLVSLIQAAVVLLTVSIGLSAGAIESSAINADIADVARFTPRALPDAAVLSRSFATDPRFLVGGAVKQYGLYLDDEPQYLSNGDTSYNATFMVKINDVYNYRKVTIQVGDVATVVHTRRSGSTSVLRRQVTNVTVNQDIPLSSMHFQISVGQVERMVVVESVENRLTMTFPLGLGGLDEGVMGFGNRLLTPMYQGAYIERAHVVPHRTHPTYYRNEPFIAITNARGVLSPIAFHISILSDDEYQRIGTNYLRRGFESHGCMRMRQKDLHEFYAIVMNSADDRIPTSINAFVWNRNSYGQRGPTLGQIQTINPYPFDHTYQTITNFAPPGMPPEAQRDPEEHLADIHAVPGEPNLAVLREFQGMNPSLLMEFESIRARVDLLRR